MTLTYDGVEPSPLRKRLLFPLMRQVFDRWYYPRAKASQFHRTWLHGLDRLKGTEGPYLVLANHTSWWDGFFCRDLIQQHLPAGPNRPFCLVKHDQLAKHPMLEALGSRPVNADDASMTLSWVKKLAQYQKTHPQFGLIVFPQGRIESSRKAVEAQRGFELFARKLAPVTLVYCGLHIEPMQEMKAQAFMNVGSVVRAQSSKDVPNSANTARRIEAALGEVHGLIDTHGEDLGSVLESDPTWTQF